MNPQTSPIAPPPPPPPPPATLDKKRDERPIWHDLESFQGWAVHIFGALIRNIFANGVSSFAELHRKVQDELEARVPEDHLRRWLQAMGDPYANAFARRRVIKIDPVAPTNLAPTPPTVPTAADDEAPEIEVPPATNPRPADPPLAPGQRPPQPVLEYTAPTTS
ncbi:MAG: hypothetical protein ACK5U7_07575 [Bacteroidota bacterium]|jgi:hypothetical protein